MQKDSQILYESTAESCQDCRLARRDDDESRHIGRKDLVACPQLSHAARITLTTQAADDTDLLHAVNPLQKHRLLQELSFKNIRRLTKIDY